MNKNKEYFIYLIKCFLNKENAAYDESIDFDEIYHLADIHNVCGVAANQLLSFPSQNRKSISNLSKFRQQLGQTVMSYDEKKSIEQILRTLFSENETTFIFVKGTAIRKFYPTPELRTSSDIDLYFKAEDYDKILGFVEDKFQITAANKNEIVIKMNGETVELHSCCDYDNKYFANIFSIAEKIDSYEYALSTEDELLFALCHIAKHFNHCGAGIRMFMDIDVIIRNTENFNLSAFLKKARQANIETFTEYVLSLIKIWFDTPVDIKNLYQENSKLLNIFENVIIDGGNFGFESRQLGEYYINQGIGKNGKNNILAKIKALALLLFPKAESLKSTYNYCAKHPILLPMAWLNRIADGLFKRGKNSINTVTQIMHTGQKSEDYRKLMTELEIQVIH
ncbi:MAG: nucleotidyltransferase family protein [Clostridium sp.]|nr:nucleotidyltransferase family protein [Clostridium sp.]